MACGSRKIPEAAIHLLPMPSLAAAVGSLAQYAAQGHGWRCLACLASAHQPGLAAAPEAGAEEASGEDPPDDSDGDGSHIYLVLGVKHRNGVWIQKDSGSCDPPSANAVPCSSCRQLSSIRSSRAWLALLGLPGQRTSARSCSSS